MTNRQSQLELITKFINFVIRTMSKENETPQICTYVCKIQEENEDNADIIKSSLQLLLGPEHEVMSLTKMRFCAPSTDDSSVLQHVIKRLKLVHQRMSQQSLWAIIGWERIISFSKILADRHFLPTSQIIPKILKCIMAGARVIAANER